MKFFQCHKIYVLLAVVINFCSAFSDARVGTSTIQQINSISQIRGEIDKADKNTLVVFDVDDVLILPKDPLIKVLFTPRIEIYFDCVEWGFIGKCRKKSGIKFKPIIYDIAEYKVIEPVALEIINDLKKRNIKTIALSNCPTGRCSMASYASWQEWRYKKLLKAGIDFSASFPEKDFVMKSWVKQVNGVSTYPVFYKGMLLTNSVPKGQILAEFFRVMSWTPKKIIFVDDDSENNMDIFTTMESLHIDCTCYWYTGAPKIKMDQTVITLQLDYLNNHKKYVSNDVVPNLDRVKS